MSLILNTRVVDEIEDEKDAATLCYTYFYN